MMVSLKVVVVALHLLVSLLLVLPTPLLGRPVGRAQLDAVTSHHVSRRPHDMKQLMGTPSEGKKTGTLSGHGHANQEQQQMMMVHRRRPGGIDTVQIAGSSLPDCSHACGSCSPCRLVMVDEDERRYWRDEKGREELVWSDNCTTVNSQLVQCFSNAMVGSRSWFGGFFNRLGNRRQGSGENEKNLGYFLTPLQEQRLQRLKDRLQVPFDEMHPDHQDALTALWKASFPGTNLTGLVSEQWKEMGWQGPNPSTDFRGCGFVSLENLLFFARTYPASYQRLLFKQGGVRATWEYPFAVAGINISFMLIQMLDLYSARPKSVQGLNFIRILSEDEEAFDVLYCIAFVMMDAQWLALRASYMQFNEVLQATRAQLERELLLEDVRQIQDLPGYNLLYHCE